MKQLQGNVKASFQKFIKELRKESPISWFTKPLEKYFGGPPIEYRLDREEVFKEVMDVLSKKEDAKLIIFPEPGEDLPKGWGITEKPIEVLATELLAAQREIFFGFTNGYIIPAEFPPRWAIVLCHEQDIHILGVMQQWLSKKKRPA